MANEAADAISADIITTKKWHLVPSGGKPFLQDRLMAGFVWRRVRDLLAAVGEAAIRQRIDAELGAVGSFLDIRVGADRRSGTFFTRAPGSSDTNNHLDLADLAQQRVTGNDPGKVRRRTDAAIDTRSKSVLMIVWRAVVFEAPILWRNSPALDQDALDELLDRRLRAVERMRYQVGDRHTMMVDNNAKFNFVRDPDTTDPTSNWFDDLRVRLFEYMSFPGAVFNIPFLPTHTWEPGDGGVSANYHKLPAANRTLDGVLFDESPANAWRFPIDIADKWQVSLATEKFGVIDLAASIPFNAAQVIDSLFDYRTPTILGVPRKKDIWNRAWLLCDQVLSAIQIEALLFALRRRPGVTDPENVFTALAQKRPPVTVSFGTKGTHTFDTAFVALGGRVRNENEGPGADGTVLMMSDKPSGDPFADPYFRNELTTIDELQPGDQIKLLNAAIYGALTRNEGIWKLENALVMEVEPTADNAANRTGIDLGSLRLQGHGTKVETYDSMRETLGRELDKLLVPIYRDVKLAVAVNDTVFFVGQKRSTSLAELSPDTPRVFHWAPFPENNKLTLGLPFMVGGKPGLQFEQLNSEPWWVALPLGKISIGDALATAPHAIGGPNATAAGAAPVPRLPEFKLAQNEEFFAKYVVFPLFEPVLAADDEIPGRPPWVAYFKKRQQVGAHDRELRSINAAGDVSLIPGLFYRQTGTVLKRKFGTVRPRARALP